MSAHRVYDLRHTFASVLLARGVPLTYVSAQLGHALPTTTQQFYARWIPAKGERFIEAVDDRTADSRWHRLGTKSDSGAPDAPEAPETIGGPSRTRTLDPLIKSRGAVTSRPSVFLLTSAQLPDQARSPTRVVHDTSAVSRH